MAPKKKGLKDKKFKHNSKVQNSDCRRVLDQDPTLDLKISKT